MNRKPGHAAAEGSRREGLGRAVQSLRAERGLKRQALAERAGLSYAYLAEIENGKKEPSTRVLDAIARALGVRLPELMELAESLQAMADGTQDWSTAPQARRAMSFPRSTAGGLWFHREIAPAAAIERSRQREEMATPKAPDAGSSGRRLEELQTLASRLSPQDLERLLDLARRLSNP